jgi:cell division protein FtsL
LSSIARKLQQEQQRHVGTKTKKIKVKGGITIGEKILYLTFSLFIAFFAVKIISAQANIYSTNNEIIALESKIENQEKLNKDYADQVAELSTYDRIWQKAKELGLTLKDKNVKVVQD